MATDADRIEQLDQATDEAAGVKSVEADGTKVAYDPADRRATLDQLRRREARRKGTRPRVASIDIAGAW